MRAVLVLTAVVTLVACGRPTAESRPAQYELITAAQIEKSEATNAYEVIQRLRPNFLASHGPTNLRDGNPTLPNVYVDDVPYGPVSSLTTIAATDIAVIRRFSAGEATFKFGTGNVGGVIAVYTKH